MEGVSKYQAVAVLGRGKGGVAPSNLSLAPPNIPFAPTWNLYWIHSVKDTLQLNDVCLKLHTKITTTKQLLQTIPIINRFVQWQCIAAKGQNSLYIGLFYSCFLQEGPIAVSGSSPSHGAWSPTKMTRNVESKTNNYNHKMASVGFRKLLRIESD